MKLSEVALLGFLLLSLVLVGATVVGNLQDSQGGADGRGPDYSRPSNFALPTPLPTQVSTTTGAQEQGEDSEDAAEGEETLVPVATMDCTDPTADC